MNLDKSEILIDKYLSGELNDTELLDVNELLKRDANFANEVKFQQEVMASIEDAGKRRLRKTLSEIHKEERRKSAFSIHSWRVQTIAASFLITLLLASGILINNMTKAPSSEVLFEEYFSPESALLTVRSDMSAFTTIDQGMNYYVQEDYKAAIETFQSDASSMLGKLYTGFSLMHLDKFEQAEKEFEAILSDNDNLFLDQAEWNLGLCYLITGKVEKASETFTAISKGNTVYNKKAIELLTEMGTTN